MLTLDEKLTKIAESYDEITIMEALSITSYDLIERFADKVEQNIDKFELDEESYDEYE